jgi:hypothetical protein
MFVKLKYLNAFSNQVNRVPNDLRWQNAEQIRDDYKQYSQKKTQPIFKKVAIEVA